jgi:predicted exporter
VKAMQELAQMALDVQDASNLSGVIHSWSEVISALRGLLPNASTDDINRHPINELFASKVTELTWIGITRQDRYEQAYVECEQLTQQ